MKTIMTLIILFSPVSYGASILCNFHPSMVKTDNHVHPIESLSIEVESKDQCLNAIEKELSKVCQTQKEDSILKLRSKYQILDIDKFETTNGEVEKKCNTKKVASN